MLLELDEYYSKSRIVDLINRLFRINALFPDVREPTLLYKFYLTYRSALLLKQYLHDD